MTEPRTRTHDLASDFVVTKEYRRFVEFCEACRRYGYIGLCYGPPGVGKTLSARRYAQWDLLEPFVDSDKREPGDGDPPAEITRCWAVLYTPAVANHPNQIARAVGLLRHNLRYAIHEALYSDEELLSHPVQDKLELVLVDEADRLKMAGLEQLRDMFDRDGIGLVLIGMPGIEKRLSRYPQLYSRVGFVHNFRPLGAKEVRFILKNKWGALGLDFDPADFADEEAEAAVIRITGGNFRLLHRLLSQIERVLQVNELRLVTKEVVETARESLVIGVA